MLFFNEVLGKHFHPHNEWAGNKVCQNIPNTQYIYTYVSQNKERHYRSPCWHALRLQSHTSMWEAFVVDLFSPFLLGNIAIFTKVQANHIVWSTCYG